jgi:hypothetical protein
VTARFDTIRLTQVGPDRVLVTGVTGEPPPETLKVAVNRLGGYRNTMTLVLTGLDLAAKARLAEKAIWARVPKESFEQAHVDLTPLDGETALLRITVMDPDQKRAGRAFSSAVVETGLASYPGFYGLTPPGDATAYGVYSPSSIARDKVHVQVWLDGREIAFPPDEPPRPRPLAVAPPSGLPYGTHVGPWTTAGLPLPADVPEETVPLGRIAGARSGDKGGDANLGVWVRTSEEYAWLSDFLTVERLCELLPEVRALPIERFALPNLLALNFVVYGLLGQGVAASPRLDPQAKALGERLRAVRVHLPGL